MRRQALQERDAILIHSVHWTGVLHDAGRGVQFEELFRLLPPKVLFATRPMFESGQTCTVQHSWVVPPLSPAFRHSQSYS